MPTLLQINSAKNVLSTGKIAEQIGLVAQENGWDCYIASSARYTRPGNIKHIQIGSLASEYFHALFFSRILDHNGLGSHFGTWCLINKIKRLKPDVIHLHNLHGHYINYKILFKYLRKANIPVVWTLHDCWAFTGRCCYFDSFGCEQWKTGCMHCTCPGVYPASPVMNRARSLYQLKKILFTSIDNMRIVTVSKWLGGLAEESFLKVYPVLPIYNGIDTEIYRPLESDLRERLGLHNKFIMIAVASIWNSVKGLDDYVKLSEMLTEEEQMILIGVSDEVKRTLPKKIIGISKTENQEELVRYYTMADVVLNLSYQETFGMTTAEGMACGTPSIVYNKTASPELISEGTGYILEGGDIAGVYKALQMIKANGSSTYAKKCRDRALKEFSKKKCYLQYVDLYNDIIKRK